MLVRKSISKSYAYREIHKYNLEHTVDNFLATKECLKGGNTSISKDEGSQVKLV